MAKHLPNQLIFALLLVGALIAPVYLLAPRGSVCRAICPLGMQFTWYGTALAAYGTFRFDRRRYVALLLVGLAFTAFWVWAVYDANVLQYRR